MPAKTTKKDANKFTTPSLECTRSDSGKYKCYYLARGRKMPGAVMLDRKLATMMPSSSVWFNEVNFDGNVSVTVSGSNIHAGTTSSAALKCRMSIDENKKLSINCGTK